MKKKYERPGLSTAGSLLEIIKSGSNLPIDGAEPAGDTLGGGS